MSAEERVRDYARALYETAVERWAGALESLADQVEQHPDLHERLLDGSQDFAQRQRLIDGMLPADVDLPVRNFVYSLIQYGDLNLLAEVARALRQRAQSATTGPTEVEVVSAVPLSVDQRQALLGRLQEQHGTALDIHYRVDPAILGGLIIRVGDKLLDNSVATRLAAMRQTLGVTSSQ